MQANWFLTSRSLVLSIILHVILGIVLIYSFDFSSKPTPPTKPVVNIVKAAAVDKKQVDLELKRLKEQDDKKIAKEIKRQKDLEKQAEDAKKKRLQEEQKLNDIKKKKEQETKKRKQEEVRIKKLEKEKKELEKNTKLEQEKKKKAEDERKKKEEEKRNADEEKKRQQKEQALQDQLNAELEAEQEQQDLSQIERYKSAIGRAIRDEFITTGLPEGLSCIILIRMLAGGKVADVSIIKSSNNSLFDKRAENAVYSASPLPAPDEERLLNKMRTIEFLFSP